MEYQQHIILDLEFNPVADRRKMWPRNEIIEIAAIKLDAGYREISRFEALIRPAHNTEVTRDITRLTGLHTADVAAARSFAAVMDDFRSWVGEEYSRVYSWSNNDLNQLWDECEAKEVEFPFACYHWMDLQPLFPRLISLPEHRCLSLSAAAANAGIPFDKSAAHRAMYDTVITTELLHFLTDGRSKTVAAKNRTIYLRQVEHTDYSVGTVCAPALSALLQRLRANPCPAEA